MKKECTETGGASERARRVLYIEIEMRFFCLFFFRNDCTYIRYNAISFQNLFSSKKHFSDYNRLLIKQTQIHPHRALFAKWQLILIVSFQLFLFCFQWNIDKCTNFMVFITLLYRQWSLINDQTATLQTHHWNTSISCIHTKYREKEKERERRL